MEAQDCKKACVSGLFLKKFSSRHSKLFLEQGEESSGSAEDRQVVSASVLGAELENLETPVTFSLPNPDPGEVPQCAYWDKESECCIAQRSIFDLESH